MHGQIGVLHQACLDVVSPSDDPEQAGIELPKRHVVRNSSFRGLRLTRIAGAPQETGGRNA